MIFTPLRYFVYKFLSSRILNRKPSHYRHILSRETLSDLKQRVKDSHLVANKVVTDLSTHKIAVSENIHQVFNKYGKPSYLKSNKSGGIVHDVVLYKRLINGLKSQVIYHFVNQNIASVSYTVQVLSKTDEHLLHTFLKENTTYPHPKPARQPKSAAGNKMAKNSPADKPKEISLTFINHNPEVIQNINAAVYINKYSNSNTKYVDSSKFQLTF
jgi:hypothetical protein